MVLIFGVNVPLIELNIAFVIINFILMIEITVVLIIIMYQLRAIKKVYSGSQFHEVRKIHETDLSKGSERTKERNLLNLEKFIVNSVIKNTSKDDIINELVLRGWPKDYITNFVERFFDYNEDKIRKLRNKKTRENILRLMKDSLNKLNKKLDELND